MERLPLFPLNTVLFPGMPLYLHIFEERYQLMITRCIEKRTPFGVVMIKTGTEVEGLGAEAVPYLVGCTAHITQIQELGDGRKNIVAIGHERFEIVAQHRDQPYLTGDVDILLLKHPGAATMSEQVQPLRTTLERYLRALEQIENTELDKAQLPDDPLALTYLAASVLRIPGSEKQALLAENDAVALVNQLKTLYRREVALLNIMAASAAAEATDGPFSLN